MLGTSIRLQRGRIKKHIRGNHKAEFNYTNLAVKQIASHRTEVESGGRMTDAILTNTMRGET